MTDITELAHRLKAAADREMICRDVAETSEIWERTVTPENILALVEALENSESRLHEVAVACATAEQALEKAQTINAAQDDHINQQQDRIDQLEKGHQEAAKQINSWRRMAKQNIAEREKDIAELDAARQRIAELESRTVKLPDLRQIVSGGRYVWSDGVYNYSQDVKVALAAAGIKVEAE